MSQPNNSQNLYYPRNDTNFGIYGNRSSKNNTPKYNNHAKLIQAHILKVSGNSQNIEDLMHYEEIEKIAKDRQQLILAEIKAHNRGSKRKTRRNKH